MNVIRVSEEKYQITLIRNERKENGIFMTNQKQLI